jgi:hypothetical protein
MDGGVDSEAVGMNHEGIRNLVRWCMVYCRKVRRIMQEPVEGRIGVSKKPAKASGRLGAGDLKWATEVWQNSGI